MASTRSRCMCAAVVVAALAIGIAVVCTAPCAEGPFGPGEGEANGVRGEGGTEGSGDHDDPDGRRDGQDASRPGAETSFDVHRSPAGTYTSRTSEPLEQAASLLVCQYRDLGTCLVLQAGYIDLLGNVWGCVVQGPGWVDVCVVSEGRDDGSVVRVERMDPNDEDSLARSLGGKGDSRPVDG